MMMEGIIGAPKANRESASPAVAYSVGKHPGQLPLFCYGQSVRFTPSPETGLDVTTNGQSAECHYLTRR